MTILNIGTDKGNLTGIAFKKEFNELSTNDIFETAKRLLKVDNTIILGWVDVTIEFIPDEKSNLSEIRKEIQEKRTELRDEMELRESNYPEYNRIKTKIQGIDIALQIIEKYIVKP